MIVDKLDHCPLCIIGHWFLLPPKYIKEVAERQFRVKFLALEFRLSPLGVCMMVVWSLKWVGSYHEWAVHKRRSKTASEIMCFQIIRVLHKRHRIREPKVDNFLCWGVSWISKQHSSRVFFFSMSSETRLVSSNPVYTFFVSFVNFYQSAHHEPTSTCFFLLWNVRYPFAFFLAA